MKSLLSIFVIAVCVGVYFVYVKPMTVDIKAYRAQKAEFVDLLNKVQQITEKRDALSQDYDSISTEEIDRLNKIVPETFNSVQMLNNLSVLVSKYGVSIKDFKVTPDNKNTIDIAPDSSSNYKTTNITMKFNGQYDQFIKVLNEIESSLVLIDIIGLDITGGSAGGKLSQSTSMDYTLEAKTYSLK